MDLYSRIWGIDVSQYNGNFTASRLPALNKFTALGGRFIIIRSSYGVVTDKAFPYFLQAAKDAGLNIALYHYMDYYSHTAKGITSSQWGIQQAEKIWELNKTFNFPVFIDVESASIAPNISTVWPTAMTILDNIFRRYDALSGKTAGLYASTGWLIKFYDYQKSRPLFAANYNPHTPDEIQSIVKNTGFTNLVAWQYASHGDINGDGVGDGVRMGMDNPSCDLNIWMRDAAHYQSFFGGVTPPVVVEPEPEPIQNTRLVDVKTVQIGTLNIRRGAGTSYGVAGTLLRGNVVECLEYKLVNGNTWARVGQAQWIAANYNGQNYIA